MDHNGIFNRLRQLQAHPLFQENPTLAAILKQTVRMAKADAQTKHLGNMLDALSLEVNIAKIDTDQARLRVLEFADLCRQLQAAFLDSAGATLSMARLYEKLAEEAE